MSDTFVWNAGFELGIASVDDQHKHLVALINHLAEQLLTGNLTAADRQGYLQEVVAYSHYHFDEEKLY